MEKSKQIGTYRNKVFLFQYDGRSIYSNTTTNQGRRYYTDTENSMLRLKKLFVADFWQIFHKWKNQEKIKEELEKLYQLNSYISLNYVALKKEPQMSDLRALNTKLSSIIKNIREEIK